MGGLYNLGPSVPSQFFTKNKASSLLHPVLFLHKVMQWPGPYFTVAFDCWLKPFLFDGDLANDMHVYCIALQIGCCSVLYVGFPLKSSFSQFKMQLSVNEYRSEHLNFTCFLRYIGFHCASGFTMNFLKTLHGLRPEAASAMNLSSYCIVYRRPHWFAPLCQNLISSHLARFF